MVTWIPVHIVSLNFDLFKNDYIVGPAVVIAHTNSIIHPFLYAFRMEDIKKAVLKLLHINSSRSSPNISNHNQS